jgi:hypothetical protein
VDQPLLVNGAFELINLVCSNHGVEEANESARAIANLDSDFDGSQLVDRGLFQDYH